MLGWQNPTALWALSVIAVPIIVHLLRTHHAKRIAFPTLRFVQPSRTAAVRMRMPSDVLLMLIRMAIVAAAAAGLAGPILLTNSRLSTWDARIARAVVIDRSESMRARNSTGAAPETAAAEAAEAEVRTATYASKFTATDVEDGVVRASRWLAAQPPSRREIVVISDLQRGALDESLVNCRRPRCRRPVHPGRRDRVPGELRRFAAPRHAGHRRPGTADRNNARIDIGGDGIAVRRQCAGLANPGCARIGGKGCSTAACRGDSRSLPWFRRSTDCRKTLRRASRAAGIDRRAQVRLDAASGASSTRERVAAGLSGRAPAGADSREIVAGTLGDSRSWRRRSAARARGGHPCQRARR